MRGANLLFTINSVGCWLVLVLSFSEETVLLNIKGLLIRRELLQKWGQLMGSVCCSGINKGLGCLCSLLLWQRRVERRLSGRIGRMLSAT